MRTRIPKPETLVSSTKWTPDKKLEAKELHPTVVNFCAGLSVYRLKEITKDNWGIEENERSSNGILYVPYNLYYKLYPSKPLDIEKQQQNLFCRFNTVDTTTRTKRRQQFRNMYDICWNQRNAVLRCPDNVWELKCKFVGRSCAYWARCRHPSYGMSSSRNTYTSVSQKCTFVHNRSSAKCCEFTCPWWYK